MKTIKYAIIFLLIVMLNACNNDEFLETQRPPEFGWKNLAELEYAAVSPYNRMFYGGYGALQSIIVTNQVMMSDYFKFFGNPEDYSTAQLYNRQMDLRVSEIEGLYTSLYTVIGLANNGLTFINSKNDNPFKSTSTDELNEVKRIKGELYFLRAYAYYQLATLFCPAYNPAGNDSKILVKRDSVVYSGGDALNNAPAATDSIYTLIVNDLKKAKVLLPVDWSTGMHESYKNRARANKWTASAFLAQVYFTMHKFTGVESALTELDDVITNGGYTLVSNPFDNFKNQSSPILKSENSEVIFWSYYADQRLLDKKISTKMHESLRYTHFNKCGRDAMNGGNGNTSSGTSPKWSNFQVWIQMSLANSSLLEMGWLNADGTESATARYDLRYYNVKTPATSGYVNENGLFYRYEGAYPDVATYTTATGLTQLGRRTNASDDGKYIVNSKYANLIGTNEPVVFVNKYYRSTDGKKQNIPIIRLAELYLNRAMIKMRDGIPGWAADYNQVASRAWNATLAGTVYVPKTDGEVTEKMILVERWKELAGEDGWYMAFCQALGYTIGKGDRVDNSTDLTPPYSNKYWQNCIPLSEIDFQKR